MVGSDALQGWLEAAWADRGTDVHVAVGVAPVLRVDGTLRAIEGAEALSEEDVDGILRDLIGDRIDELGDNDVDFGFTWGGRARIRGNAYQDMNGRSVALRLIPLAVPTVDDLGLPQSVSEMLKLPSGLVIVTGPTGAGKSTTLAAMLDSINQVRSCHNVTIEDPIEYVHANKQAFINQRQIGVDAPNFADALKAVVRQDPDVVLVGEMRDLESIQTTITIAETGHLVFATLHTNDTAQAVDRIVDVFPAERRAQIQVQLSATLQGVIYQRLIPKKDKGMVAAYEVLVANNAVRNLIREGKSRQLRNVVATSQADGMQTLEASLSQLVTSGVVTRDAAEAVSLHPGEVARLAATAPPPPA
jgi:twitching motility protein PilT